MVEPEHGGLHLAESAWPVLKGSESVRLRRDPAPSRAKSKGAAVGASIEEALSSAQDRDLFEALRAKRLEMAQGRNVPPYVIFHDRTLIEMVMREKPSSLETMAEIPGVGAAKLEKYGETFLAVIREAG